jgi:glycosyltransferase involved in cell wall biosynthesis
MKNENLKISFVVLELSVGGLERMVVQLATELIKHNVKCQIIILEGEKYNALTLVCEVDEKIEVHYLQGNVISKSLSLLKLTKNSLVHLHFFGGLIRPVFRLFLLRRKKIFTYHNVYSSTRKPIINIIDRLFSYQLDAIVAVSDSVKDYCINYLKLSQAKVQTIYNGVEINNNPVSEKDNLNGDTLKLVVIGRLATQKNHITLFNAIAKAKQKGCKIHLNLIGDGPDIVSLLKLASQLDIRKEITWIGEMWAHSIVGKLLKEADAFVSTSLWEGLPLSILEAMSVEIPVIASDIPPTRKR